MDTVLLEAFASPFNCAGPALTSSKAIAQTGGQYRYFTFFDAEDRVFGSSGDFFRCCER